MRTATAARIAQAAPIAPAARIAQTAPIVQIAQIAQTAPTVQIAATCTVSRMHRMFMDDQST